MLFRRLREALAQRFSQAMPSRSRSRHPTELLDHAYRLGAGDPWTGCGPIADATERPLAGVHDPIRALRARLHDATPATTVTATAQCALHPEHRPATCPLCERDAVQPQAWFRGRRRPTATVIVEIAS